MQSKQTIATKHYHCKTIFHRFFEQTNPSIFKKNIFQKRNLAE